MKSCRAYINLARSGTKLPEYSSPTMNIFDILGPSIIDEQWNEHYMLCGLEQTLELDISIIIDNDMNIISQEISKINNNYAQHSI